MTAFFNDFHRLHITCSVDRYKNEDQKLKHSTFLAKEEENYIAYLVNYI